MSDFDLVVDIPNAALWPLKSADSLCSVISRGTAPVYVEKSEVMAIGQRCVSAKGFIAKHARPHLESATSGVLRPEVGDVLLNSTGTGTIGRSAVFDSPGNFIVDGHVTMMRPRPDSADGRWLNSVLQTPHAQRHLERFCYAGSTNQLELSRTPLRLSHFPTPSLKEQERIGSVVDTLDTAIHETEALIAKLKALKQGLLHDLMTRGIDANGELRPPQSEAPDLYKSSPVGWIPKEWSMRVGEQVCDEIVVGIVIRPTQYYRDEGVPVLRSANVRENRLSLDDLVFMSDRDHRVLGKSAVRPGDVLTVRTGYPGTSCVVDSSIREANCVDIIISRPSDALDSNFWSIWINSDRGRSQVLAAQGGLAQQHFNVGDLQKLKVSIPPIAEQTAITSRIAVFERRLGAERDKLSMLTNLKHGVMDDLLTGRVRVTPLLDAATA